jgi:pilus assembly protein CpaB
MRTKSLVLLILALGCGLVASIGISQIIEQNKSGQQPATETQAILVAMKPIAGQEQIKAENVKLEQWPKNLVPKGALSKLEEVEGHRVKYNLTPGEPILQTKLVGDQDQRATTVVPPGYRLKAVHADAVSAVGNLIQPGDRVDVLVYLRSTNGGQQAATTTTILQDIKVFAVNDQWRAGEAGGTDPIPVKNVSLLLTPEQVEKLTLASELGKVSLVLRSPDDKLKSDVGEGTTSKDLFGLAGHDNRRDEMDFLAHSGKPQTKSGGGFLGMLGIGGNPGGDANPAMQVASVPTEAVERFSMELITGPQARTVEFTRETGGNARWQPSSGGRSDLPSPRGGGIDAHLPAGVPSGVLTPSGSPTIDPVSFTPGEKE